MVRASVEPYSNLTYVLEYVEVLERNRGLYRDGVHFDPEYSGLVIYFNKLIQTYILTPRLSRLKNFNDATFIIQNWLVSRPVANIFPRHNFTEEHKWQFLKFLAKILNYVEIIF